MDKPEVRTLIDAEPTIGSDASLTAGRRGRTGMVRTRRLLSGIAIAGVALGAWTAAPAYASSQGASASQWANGVCSAIQTFGQSVNSTITSLKGSGSLDTASQKAKDGLSAALTQFENSLQKLGKPTTTDGAKVQSAVQSLSNQLSSDINSIQQSLSPAPSNPGDIAATFAQIGVTVQKGVSQTKAAASTLKGLQPNGELQKAFQNSSACKAVKNSL
jgi:hypothetical protein